jgi:hypothetical protein
MKYLDINIILTVFPLFLILVGLGLCGGTALGVAIVILSWPFAVLAGFSFGCWLDTHFN